LEDSKNAVISGKWTEKSSGGCHLYDKEYEQKSDKFTWTNNPKFHLRFQTPNSTEVKITVSRPEKAWKKSIGMNLVGSMLGFYVYPGNQQPTKDNLLNKETQKFVPWNEITSVLEMDGSPDGYILMPTTYEPGLQGPFIVSVSTDVEFTLTSLD
jgi:hypothetical protein